MRLEAGCELNIETEDETPLIAMLRPQSGAGQWIARESYKLEPFTLVHEYTDAFGNLCQRMVAPAGRFHIRVDVQVETADNIRVAAGAPYTPIQELPVDTLQFLLPSRYCPADELTKEAREAIGRAAPGYDQVEAIRSWIQSHLKYKYGVSNSTTTARDTLKDGAGVCRDFAHVGISFCRALNIPARMVVGWLHELDPMDMHAWFEAFVGGRWYTFDATQKEPRGGRIAVAYGRDAVDVALFNEYGATKLRDMKVWVKRA